MVFIKPQPTINDKGVLVLICLLIFYYLNGKLLTKHLVFFICLLKIKNTQK